ncbi:ergothioneine biosynthesis protein EgtC [Streptomyces sp. B6B3]|uniref:ergothioneine biosynthesis protein EgtC n=1 Tax=Streptomyces sp. B6B3 TaxID=3153570 RepID=UPI00325F477D
MCRHLAYLGPPRSLAELLTQPPHGLLAQSWRPRLQRHGTVNADGFGIGWYLPEPAPCPTRPARYRRAVPIWTDANVPELARAIHSRAVLAAVRSATPGCGHEEAAAAPYALGRWLFSHNGAVGDWRQLPADAGMPLEPDELLGVEAHCDSALLWLLISRRLSAGEPPADALAAVVRATAAVRPDARLTLLLTDGRTIAAVRHGDSLWHRAAPGEVLVASEPTDGDDGWREVPDGSLLLAAPGAARILPLGDPAGAGREEGTS